MADTATSSRPPSLPTPETTPTRLYLTYFLIGAALILVTVSSILSNGFSLTKAAAALAAAPVIVLTFPTVLTVTAKLRRRTP
jgi:hypothetical protein